MTDYWNDFYGFEQGGGGVICKVLVQTGYKTYAEGFTGNSQEETFFPSKARESEIQQAAKTKAQVQCKAHPSSKTNKPAAMDFGVMIRQYRTTAARASGREMGWDFDQFDFTANYHQSTKEVVMPSLKEHGVTGPLLADNRWEGWVRLAWKDDPYKVTMNKARGDGSYDQVVYFTEVFESEEAARAAISVEEAEAGVSVAGDVPVPAAYGDRAMWESVWGGMYKDQQEGAELKDIAKEYQASVPEVTKALAAYIPM